VTKNYGSLCTKQHVIFYKTTRRFPQNNTSLSIKQHVIFHKTTGCFWCTRWCKNKLNWATEIEHTSSARHEV